MPLPPVGGGSSEDRPVPLRPFDAPRITETEESLIATARGLPLGRDAVPDLPLPGIPTPTALAPNYRGLGYYTADSEFFKQAESVQSSAKTAPIPADPQLIYRNAFSMLPIIAETDKYQPWDSQRILSNARALADVPQIATLSQPLVPSPGVDPQQRSLFGGVRGPESMEDIAGIQEVQIEERARAILGDDSDKAIQAQSAARFILENPSIIEAWQSAIYPNILAAPLMSIDGSSAVRGGDEDTVTQMLTGFSKSVQHDLTPDELGYIGRLIAYMPDAHEMQVAAGVDPAEINWFDSWGQFKPWGLGLAEDFATGVETMFKAPGSLVPTINDPRTQMLTELFLWVKENPLETVEDRGRFMSFATERAYASVQRAESESSGFGAAGAIAEMPGHVLRDAISEVGINIAEYYMGASSGPNEYVNAKHLSLGQNLAIMGGGMNPSDGAYREVSGGLDMAGTWIADPINLFVGVGLGMKNVTKVIRPATVSRGELFRDVFKPRSKGVYGNLPLASQGVIPRAWYATFSKTIDDVIDGRQFNRIARRITKADSSEAVAQILPEWATSSKLLEYAAESDTIELSKEIVRAGLKAPELLILEADAPLWASRTADGFANAVTDYRKARAAYLADGGVLADFGKADDVQAILVPARVPASGGDQGVVQSLTRNSERARSYPEIATVDITDGKMLIRGSGDTVFGYDEATGEFLGAVQRGKSATPQFGTVQKHEGRGVNRALREQIPDYGINRSPDAPISRQGKAALGMSDNYIFVRNGEVAQDGTTKVVVSNVDGSVKNIDLSGGGVAGEELQTFLFDAGYQDDAAKLMVGETSLSDLSVEAQDAVRGYVHSKGATHGSFRGEVIVTPQGMKTHVTAVDGASTIAEMGPNRADALSEATMALTEAKIKAADFNAKIDPRLWLISDQSLSLGSWTSRIRKAASTRSTNSMMQYQRRVGARITQSAPGNISLTDTAEGAKQLRTWVKLLGGTDEQANRIVSAYRAGNVGTRQQIIREGFAEVGKSIKNPMLREGLLQFYDKPDMQTYMYVNGRELGLRADGTVKPMTISHLSTEFPMPNSRELLRSLARYRNATHMPKGLVEGFQITGTQARRKTIFNSLKRRAPTGVPDEDIWRMAYADVIGAGTGGMSQGYGAVSRAMRMTHRAYRMLHNGFVIAQLAGRPLAWSSRVLLEETVRADLMGLPSLWHNPYDWTARYMDARAIRRMPELLAKQADVTDTLVTKMFAGGFDIDEARQLIPGIDGLLARANISAGDTPRVRAFISNLVGNELMGFSDTPGTFATRGNISRRALRRRDDIKGIVSRMDEDGLLASFRWDTDGAEIANRSVFQSFTVEAQAAAQPVTWSTSGMSPAAVKTYGRAYGRQVYQMLHDPIVGSFGVNRAIDMANGQPTKWNAEKLLQGSQWPKISHIVDDTVAVNALGEMNDLAKAQWYLDEVVDPIISNLFNPLVGGDINAKAEMLRSLSHGGKYTLNIGSQSVRLDAAARNYEGFVSAFGVVADGAYGANMKLPTKVAAYFDPRFGQQITDNAFRRGTNWAMNTFGEKPSQALNRQPAYRYIHGQQYRMYRDMGWSQEAARKAAHARAAEQVNYIFFDNQHLPMFLKDMNQYVPFFSAMWEVGSTWLYKIPSANYLPVGYLDLTRRISRFVRGMKASGLISQDDEGQMRLRVTKDMEHAAGVVPATLGKALYQWTRLPVTTVEFLGGAANLVENGEWENADMDAWAKDGFEMAVGNPLDPTSHGVMAVNQFSVGLSPILSMPLSLSMDAIFANSDDVVATGGMTVAEWTIENPEADIATIMRNNQEAFEEVNTAESFKRALSGSMNVTELVMPAHVSIPNTSVWETMVDRAFFPYGKYTGPQEVILAGVPSATNHILRGLFTLSGLPGTEMGEFFFGKTTGYTMAGEVISQIQMIEYADGSVSKALALSNEAQKIIEEANLEVIRNPNEPPRLADPNSDEARQVQEIWATLDDLNTRIMKRANDNAAGAMISRGIMGHLGPSTPRMWDRQQAQAQLYWASRDLATEARASGSADFADAIRGLSPHNAFEVQKLAMLTQEWMNDPSGDGAKLWMAEQMPGLLVYAQGKSFWGPSGPPPLTDGFDAWVEQMESGDREPFEPEVFMARYLRAGISTDREIDVILEYGNDPAQATQAILADYDRYQNLVEPHNMQYDSLDFMDQYLFEGKFEAWRRDDLSDLTAFEELERRKREAQTHIDYVTDLLSASDLEPEERRQMTGTLYGMQAELDRVIEEQDSMRNEDPVWLNPREQLLDRYWRYNNLWSKDRAEVYAKEAEAESKEERNDVFEAARVLSDEWYKGDHFILGLNGEPLRVPSPEERLWNSKSEREQQELILNKFGSPPQWLSQFEVGLLVQQSPQLAEYLPQSDEDRQIYDEFTQRKWEIRDMWRENPQRFTKSQRDKMIRDEEARMEAFLIREGRGKEVEFANATPFQKLDLAGLIPVSLQGMLPQYNQVMADLRLVDKSPKTNDGYLSFMRLREWFESEYTVANPSAKEDLRQLGLQMFGEPIMTAIYSKIWQGDLFGELD